MKITPIVLYVDWLRFFSSEKYIVSGVSIFPFIFIHKNLRNTIDGRIKINHESIHFYQTLETFIIGFYLIYAFNFLVNLFKHDWYWAYKNVVFEKEAHINERYLDYLWHPYRKRYAWWKLWKWKYYHIGGKNYELYEN